MGRYHGFTEQEFQAVLNRHTAKAGRSLQSESKRVAPIGVSAAPSPLMRTLSGSTIIQTVFIPGPLPGMNDIVRKNHYVYSAMKKQWSARIAQCVRHATLHPVQRVFVDFQWRERDTRRDPDNILAGGQKLILDCLVTTGILPDDGWEEIAGLRHSFSVDAASPGVWVTLQEVAR